MCDNMNFPTGSNTSVPAGLGGEIITNNNSIDNIRAVLDHKPNDTNVDSAASLPRGFPHHPETETHPISAISGLDMNDDDEDRKKPNLSGPAGGIRSHANYWKCCSCSYKWNLVSAETCANCQHQTCWRVGAPAGCKLHG